MLARGWLLAEICELVIVTMIDQHATTLLSVMVAGTMPASAQRSKATGLAWRALAGGSFGAVVLVCVSYLQQ